ncbi:tRNA glutamyl-Q(34) synthetase GluQRS [Paeniglutamicibacter terrestris]|uniref:Glutamyl-Q tRNA(Asp) synthetase n=1 Tax=Paeniglutamicibacter terrestris TaxID=2723403 RepID=A0ABX1G545_9MICC|nr:tRNA glutamyl-Q(34) synthetase GluQRS [Paeniglutamicibacter terrestris]ASN40653.1 tRNA glutamyl-Q(34) synthetase GluQRS [Arthrobacter sp. 7749]NKG21139.1 tRNA glutamyl-Q(34) synthetase GluQRS [Paeniglutamicibacter terrestris]
MGAGRFAPSPSGELHLGNLRTAILAWLFARSTHRTFLMRVEDLDRARAGAESLQLADLAAMGLSWDGEIVRQSERSELYAQAISDLRIRGLLYECFCTRRDIAEASSAPHGAPGTYPGTCRNLTEADQAAKRELRPSALRLRTEVDSFTVHDELHGSYTGVVDDFVVLRNDEVPAYNLAVVVDDGAQNIDQVVRGDDLLSSAPRQSYLAQLLGYQPPTYAHVPLALNAEGRRLAKRDGAVTLAQLAASGINVESARAMILTSLGLPTGSLQEALTAFDPALLPTDPWVFSTDPNAVGTGKPIGWPS